MDWRKKPIKDWTIEDVGAFICSLVKAYLVVALLGSVFLCMLIGLSSWVWYRMVEKPEGLWLPTPTPYRATLGEWVGWEGKLAVRVTNYDETHTWPSGGGYPAEGAKFVVIQVEMKNISEGVVYLPYFDFELNGHCSVQVAPDYGSFDENAFGSACWQWGGKLYPDVGCGGWETFEVPESFQVDGKAVRVFGDGFEASWILE